MTLHFEGRDWPTIKALREAYPAYATTGPLEAIRAGCTTIAEVEAFRAKRMAEDHRVRQIELLNEGGAGYSQSHGLRRVYG